MENNNYVHKTTKEEYEEYKATSKNQGELLHKIFVNETGDYIPYPKFLSFLGVWFRRIHRTDTSSGVQKINKYLEQILA